ncbi:PAX-interacting protein 1-like [Lineus longissimus]|uniref:PAX-interacting protein 1-like n=1 Tax=Lineus longissimus TaxID=88925 RepID=UPI002B4C9AD4
MPITFGDPTALKVPNGLFKDVKYYLIGNLDEKIHQLLKDGGGKRDTYLSEMVSHAIADNKDHDDYSEAVELFEVPVVSPSWIVMCVKCECILPTNAFNLENYDIFTGVVACPSQIPEADLQSLWAMITFYGGQCQRELNRKCTHLITIKPLGAKYDFAIEKPDHLEIVTPDWVSDSVDKKARQDETIYHPKLLILEQPPPDIEPDSDSGETIVDAGPVSPSRTPDLSPPGDELVQTPVAKEALSKMVLDRMQAADRVGETPEAQQCPVTPNLPMFNTGTETPRTMLRNITNSHDQPKSPARMGPQKVSQLLQTLGKNGRGLQQAVQEPPIIYYGHEPSETVPPDLCLLGCVFYITDYQKYLDNKQIETWQMVIEQHGGQVDQAYSNRITHLLCENQRSDIFQLALKDGKRVVTAHWLNDCLIRQKMLCPWHALHVPSIYGDHKPCANQIICVTNFEGDERTKIKHMVTVIGAKYTGYMTHKNSALVCKKMGGLKYEKAKEWRIPVVNVAWLSDLVLGNLDALRIPVHKNYHQFGLEDDFKIDNAKVTKLLVGWRSPLKIPKDLIKKYQPSLLLKKPEDNTAETAKRKLEDATEDEQPSKRARLTPTFEMETQEETSTETVATDEGKPRVMITGIRKDLVPALVEKVEKLGGKMATRSKEVTHLVASTLSRTMKFFTTVPICKHIVTPAWIEESAKLEKFLDEQPYALKDKKNEETFGIKLSESLARARRVPLFKEVRFYITPSTEPGVGPLKEIIENAGGTVVSRRSPARVIATQKTSQGRPSFIVIGCENDLHILGDMFDKQVTVYNAEFVLTGVLKQELDYDQFHLRV